MEGFIFIVLISLPLAFLSSGMKSMQFKRYPVVNFTSFSASAATSAVLPNYQYHFFLKLRIVIFRLSVAWRVLIQMGASP